jgi:hypothetical protein
MGFVCCFHPSLLRPDQGDWSAIAMRAGDDASQVRVEEVAALQPEQFGVPDHLPMIFQAVALQF